MINEFLAMQLLAHITPGSIVTGRKAVTTAGTRVQFVTAATPCRYVEITADQGNSGVVVVGDSAVVAAAGTRQGISLEPARSVTVRVSDLSQLWLDSVTSGDAVHYAYFV